jgi:hypothetical protein
MDDDKDRSASDLADIDRASSAGERDAAEGNYDPKSEDTDDQKEAYEQSYGKARDKA